MNLKIVRRSFICFLLMFSIFLPFSFSCYADNLSTDEFLIYSGDIKRKKNSSHAYLIFMPSTNTFYEIWYDVGYKGWELGDLRSGSYSGSFKKKISLMYDGGLSQMDYEYSSGRLVWKSDLDKHRKNEFKLSEKEEDRTQAIEFLNTLLDKETEIGSYRDTLAQTFEIVQFGLYEQDGNADNGKEPIEWLVLHTENGESLLLSLYILDFQKFYDLKVYENAKLYAGWGSSSIRKWLNDDFLYSAFSSEEIKTIQDTTLYLKYPRSSIPAAIPEETTVDKVFLLNRDEISYYLEGALSNALKVESASGTKNNDGYYSWLTTDLQSPDRWFCAAEERFQTVDQFDSVGIRPAIRVTTSWLDTTKNS